MWVAAALTTSSRRPRLFAVHDPCPSCLEQCRDTWSGRGIPGGPGPSGSPRHECQVGGTGIPLPACSTWSTRLTALGHCPDRPRSLINWSDFEFDHVIGTAGTQADVYELAARPVVEDVLKGYNGCVMAYGQTGAVRGWLLTAAPLTGGLADLPTSAPGPLPPLDLIFFSGQDVHGVEPRP